VCTLTRNVEPPKSHSTIPDRMGRKDSAVHVSLSCLKPVKQQCQNDVARSQGSRVSRTQLLEKRRSFRRSAVRRRNVGVICPRPVRVSTRPFHFFPIFSKQSSSPRVATGQTAGFARAWATLEPHWGSKCWSGGRAESPFACARGPPRIHHQA
jgi:hypothetical protein